MKKPELVSPAGDWSSLNSAVRAGCDSVYFGIKKLNMRSEAGNFDLLELKKVMDFLHEKEKKGYLTLNVIVYNNEIGKVRDILKKAKEARVDAVILWDLAVLKMAKEAGLTVHLSTQASVSNLEALKYYSSMGVRRVVLARECSLKDISDITDGINSSGLDCSVETFIHGAMCVSLSGRCFLSQYSFSKSANRGECIQPCRREYTILDEEDECQYVLGEDYVMSAKDLCTINFLDKLIDSGISAFKIEGRRRPPEYVGEVTSVYREAIDANEEGKLTKALKQKLFKRLEKTFNRGFTEGFYFTKPEDLGGEPYKNYEKKYIGYVKKYYKKIGVAEIILYAGSLKKGDKVLVSGKNTPAGFFEALEMEVDHSPVEEVQRGEAVGIKVPFEVKAKDKVFLWKDKLVKEA